MKRTQISALLPALLLAACSGEPDVAMRVGEIGYTAHELAEIPVEQHGLLADLAAFGLLAAEGRLHELADELASVEIHRSRLRVLPYELAARARPESEIRAAYDANPEWELTVRHIVRLVAAGADDDVRREALEVAREAERRARAGDDFAGLAGEYSEEPGAARRGGLLRPGREGTWVDEFWEAALQLQPGEISPVVRTVHGYHVILLDARRPIPFDEAERASALRRAISPADARIAMESWVSTRPPIEVDGAPLPAARDTLANGRIPAAQPVAVSPAGVSFDGHDLALARAVLDPRERETLDDAGDAEYLRWAENEAREDIWSDEAKAMGVGPDPDIATAAVTRWRARIDREAAALGFREGMTAHHVRSTTLNAITARDQEARIARSAIPGYGAVMAQYY